MQTRNYFRLCAVVGAIGLVFATTEVRAVPRQCNANGLTVNFKGQITFPEAPQGTVIWQYEVQDNPQSPKISDVVMVVPLPVTPADIISPQPQNFCEEADPKTSINRGNCAGFPVHLPPVRSGHTVLLEVKTKATIAPGVVTLNLVGDKGASDVCIAFENDQPTGIVGPGAGPVPSQPVFITQRVKAAGGACEAVLTFDALGRLMSAGTDTPGCFSESRRLFISRDETGTDLKPLKNSTGVFGITYGDNPDTSSECCTCYGPDIPSPSDCVCAPEPCPF
jgi:hypothetical protein